ncbi:MAG: hypothetical protein ACR2NO_08720 [Chloroflexota bacterium]
MSAVAADADVDVRRIRSRRPIGQALIYADGRIKWSMLTQTEAEFVGMGAVRNLCGRHFAALGRELRSWREVSR